MNEITKKLLSEVSDWDGSSFEGAYNIREDGGCAGRQSSEHIQIKSKEGKPGLEIYISKEAKNETVYIPACVTHGAVDDLVYNDFYVAAGADVTISAGCGVHNDSDESARHNGIHRFFIEENAHVLYKEKHVGTGTGSGDRKIDPVTEIVLGEGAVLEMNTMQIGGVDRTNRKTVATLKKRAQLIIHESLLTDHEEEAITDFLVTMEGEESSVNLISRSVAKGNSKQNYHSSIIGNCRCSGHSECDAILVDRGTVQAAPELFAGDIDASLIHEAAIGKIAGEQIIKLRTLGLTETQAEEKIIEGFLQG
ncbi:MAG: SufD family Fe-S cluster assembly protein [Clostridia bacterium]|nr:SufD family Fe-S cluster assembly protein [Clostridia bacterium]